MSGESSTTAIRLPRRRNGKEQACEPCRKGKMRCDHTLPVCNSCRRRSIIERCIYVEAPQTRPKTQRIDPKALNPSQIAAYAHTARLNVISPDLTTASMDEEEKDDPTILKASSGFFGPTSFSAVFQDNEAYESELGPKVASPPDQVTMQLGVEKDRIEEQLSARTALGIKVLTQLPNQATCDHLLELFASRGMEKGFHKPTTIYCMASFWTTFGVVLRQPRKSRDLRDIAQLLSKNTMSVLKDTHDPDVWLAQLSGRNLRWEMMGILIASLGNVLLALSEEDPFWQTQSGRRQHRKQFALEMKECVDECVKLSNQMDNINILMVSLLFKRNIVESQCTGDTSLMLWRAHGDLSFATTGLGLHRERDINSPVSVSSQMRRRIWCVIFSIDKILAAFTGRPPGLSHRFNLCPLPLDLTDEVLLAPKDELDLAISKLDENGWNQNGQFTAATSTRAVMIHSLMLSEILEVSLGLESQYSYESLIELKTRNDESYASFPNWLHLKKDCSAESTTLQWMRHSLRLRYLHCCLLIEQLLTKKAHADQQHLIDVAREMLEWTIYIWVERERFIDRHYDYDWMIMCYGIPASGVICVELLKQMKEPRSMHLRLPRSEVIQNLSMLVGFLEWVRPTAANQELCGRMSRLIKRILDRVLDPPLMTQQPAISSVEESSPMPQFDFGEVDMSDFDWLGAVDWTQGPFVDLGTEGFSGLWTDNTL